MLIFSSWFLINWKVKSATIWFIQFIESQRNYKRKRNIYIYIYFSSFCIYIPLNLWWYSNLQLLIFFLLYHVFLFLKLSSVHVPLKLFLWGCYVTKFRTITDSVLTVRRISLFWESFCHMTIFIYHFEVHITKYISQI